MRDLQHDRILYGMPVVGAAGQPTGLAEALTGTGLTAVTRVRPLGVGKPSTLSCLAKSLVSILTRIAVPFSGFFHVSI